MHQSYGKIKREKAPSPSSTRAVTAAAKACPHANLIPPESPEVRETARRAALYDEVKPHFYSGLLAHEIIALFPDEAHWMKHKIGEWEVVFRREQLQFVESQNAPAPKFAPSKPAARAKTNNLYEMPEIIDERDLSVAINVTVVNQDTGECHDKKVFFPKSQLKDGRATKWIVDTKRKELEDEFVGKGPIELQNFPR